MPCGPCLIRSYLARHASHAPAQVRAVGSSRSCSPCCGRSRLHDALLVQSCHLFDLCVLRCNYLCVSRCNYLCVSRCINAALVGLHDALLVQSLCVLRCDHELGHTRPNCSGAVANAERWDSFSWLSVCPFGRCAISDCWVCIDPSKMLSSTAENAVVHMPSAVVRRTLCCALSAGLCPASVGATAR